MDFTGVELVGGAELAASVEKAVASPMEKTAASERCGGEGGRRAAGSGVVEMQVGGAGWRGVRWRAQSPRGAGVRWSTVTALW